MLIQLLCRLPGDGTSRQHHASTRSSTSRVVYLSNYPWVESHISEYLPKLFPMLNNENKYSILNNIDNPAP